MGAGEQAAVAVQEAKEEMRNSSLTTLRAMSLLGPGEAVAWYKAKCQELDVKPNNSFVRALNQDLAVVTFSNSYFGERGMLAIAPALAQIPVIALDLRNTGLSSGDAQHLQQALVHHPTITSVDLRENTISIPTARRFLSLVTQNKRLTTLRSECAG